MDFERGFVALEQAGASTLKAFSLASTAARQLSAAARSGDLNAARRALERLSTAGQGSDREISSAGTAWPFEPADEERFLSDQYATELIAAAAAMGIGLRRLGNDLIAFPSVLRVLPRERAVLLNGKRLSVLRPSKVVARLVELRERKPALASERFLEVLYSAYRLVCGPERLGQAVALTRIYEVLTLLPKVAGEYTEAQFARDLCILDHQGPKRTRSGATVSLPAATGTRDQRRVYSFVGPDGQVVYYFGLQFAEGAP